MTDTVSVTGNCPCGERVTWTDDVTDKTILVCNKCGRELGTYGDFKRQAIDAVRDKVAGIIKDGLKGR